MNIPVRNVSWGNSPIRASGGRGAIKPWMLWVTVGVVVLIFLPTLVANINGLIANPQAVITGQSTTTKTQGGNLVTVTKPMQITCFDALAGSNCGAVTIKLYSGNSPVSLESLTASASGVATTGNSYTTGTKLTLAISGNSKATEYLQNFVVPAMDPNSAISSANNIVATYAVTLGAWTKVNTGTGGTTFTSGNQYTFGGFNGNTVTITTSLSETTQNAGYKSSFDITNQIWQYFVVQIDDGGGANSNSQFATVQGFARSALFGNTHYYLTVLPDGLSGSGVGSAYTIVASSQSAGSADSIAAGGLSQQTVGVTNYGGTAGFSWTLSVGSLTGANVETFSIKAYYYYDPTYFAANQNGGPNAAASGSTFTIKFSA